MQKVIRRRDVGPGMAELTDLQPLLQRIYSARGIATAEDMRRDLPALLPFSGLMQIDQAVARLTTALREQQKILIIGDFDTDGATSTALAIGALRAFGAEQVDYLVPNRFTYGYGLTPEIVEAAHESKPDLIVTVDNGISSDAGVARANELGIDVLVTDHHLPGKVIPKACAIVNPNQTGDTFASKSMAGVGVIFYVMLALRSHLKECGWFDEQGHECPNLAEWLDLVALGTVADVVPLDRNNRILVHQGLRRIRAGRARPGILALLEVADRRRNRVVAADLGFAIGPRLNAAGRLDDMSLGIQCLLAEEFSEAYQLARQLDDLNRERRAIEMQMKLEAFDEVERLNFEGDLPPAICLYDEAWHQGVVGLVASRVKDKVHRPTVALAKVDPVTLKGSARSIKGLNIKDVLDAIATKHPGVLVKFGGHAMAAGLSLDPDNFKIFKQAFEDEVALRVSAQDLEASIETDGELRSDFFTLEIAELLRDAGPWGQQFPEPVFDGAFHLVEQRIVGENHLRMTLQAQGSDAYIDAIAFNVDLSAWPNHHCDAVQLVFRLDINEYRGHKKLQLLVEQVSATQLEAVSTPALAMEMALA